jgi:glycosyltransferase involved in cell wall biosynthesis
MARRGHVVTVVGGRPDRMTAELDPSVRHRPAAGVTRGAVALARCGRTDVVHAHMTAAELAAWLSGPATRGPVVATRHFARDRGSSALARAVAGVAARHVTVDLAISRFVASSISGPSRLLYNGVEDRPPASLDSAQVLMLQRLDDEKAGDVGLRAFADSGIAASGWRLTVAGTGARRPQLEALAAELGVASTVDFVGPVVDTDALLDGASVFLAPAPAEPFGLSVVEAMAHGLPVVAAAGGAHLETVDDEGLLFPPGDAAAAAAHLATLSLDVGLRRRVGTQLRRRQQAHFTLARHLDELEAVYRDLASGVAAGPAPQRAATDR